MLKIGLTGAIASGKSLVGEILVSLGAHLIKADEISHQLIQPGEAVYEEVVRTFGREILKPDGTIDRSRLANSAFGNEGNKPSRVEELNKIIHPEVVRRQKEWMEAIGRQDPNEIAIVEAALIVEAGAVGDFDRMVVVTCDPQQRIERWAHRTGVGLDTARKEVERRMAAQLPEEDKVKIADYVIDNSGTVAETEGQVRRLFSVFKRHIAD
ncbi:MAG: dephospho-CoA kinase [Acidobacteriaceae bacterium]